MFILARGLTLWLLRLFCLLSLAVISGIDPGCRPITRPPGLWLAAPSPLPSAPVFTEIRVTPVKATNVLAVRLAIDPKSWPFTLPLVASDNVGPFPKGFSWSFQLNLNATGRGCIECESPDNFLVRVRSHADSLDVITLVPAYRVTARVPLNVHLWTIQFQIPLAALNNSAGCVLWEMPVTVVANSPAYCCGPSPGGVYQGTSCPPTWERLY